MGDFTKRPHRNNITRLKDTVINRLFNKIDNNDGRIVKYDIDDIVNVLNKIGVHSNIPEELRMPWGDAIRSIQSTQNGLQQIGIRGHKLQMQNKQAMVSGMIVFDDNGNICNRKLLQNMLPHKSNKGGNNFIDKCGRIRRDFDENKTDNLCIDIKLRRES